MDRNIKQKDVKWVDTENATATRNTYHGYYGRLRKHQYFDDYEVNSALCNKKFGIAEEEGVFLPIEKVEQNGLKPGMTCKRCFKIYKTLPI